MSLIPELDSYQPFNAHEAAMRDRMREFLASLDDDSLAFGRELAGVAPIWGHLTASSWIVDEGAQNVVLLHHRKLGKWLQPGGHLENERDLRGAALREAREETGLDLELAQTEIFDLDVHEIPEYWNTPAHNHYDVRFLLRGKLAQIPVVSLESRGVKWCDLELARELSKGEESVGRMIEKTRLMKP